MIRMTDERPLARRGLKTMEVLLIADEDQKNRDQIAELFDESDYEVVAADSVDGVVGDVIRKDAKVVLLGSVFDSIPASDLIPILKSCNKNLTIILISNEVSLPLMRKLRREGIFYHSLRPMEAVDREELLQAVRCAFKKVVH
jgi:DNA-binding NtrC family response regulator